MGKNERDGVNRNNKTPVEASIQRVAEFLTRIMRLLILSSAVVASLVLPRANLLQLPPDSPEKTNSLRQVHVFFRHGERMPTSLYKTDPNKPADFKYGLGRVTLKGKKDTYQLGIQLRKRYEGFLSNDITEIKARSSGRDRCLESISSFLAAFYKPEEKERIQEDLLWQPIPVQTMPVDIDGMLYEDAICKKDDELIETLRSTGEGKEVMTKFKELMEKLEKESGKKMNDWVSVRDLLDTLEIEKSLGLVIPAWADETTLAQMTECAKYTTSLNYGQEERIKLRGGLLIKDISLHFDDIVNNSPQHKVYAYASHDVLVAAYLSAFGAFNGLPVPSSTAVIVELHETSPQQFQVQTFLRNNTEPGDIMPVNVPGCSPEGCDLDKWKTIATRFIPEDWRTECGETALPTKLYERF